MFVIIHRVASPAPLLIDRAGCLSKRVPPIGLLVMAYEPVLVA